MLFQLLGLDDGSDFFLISNFADKNQGFGFSKSTDQQMLFYPLMHGVYTLPDSIFTAGADEYRYPDSETQYQNHTF